MGHNLEGRPEVQALIRRVFPERYTAKTNNRIFMRKLPIYLR